MAEEWDVIVVGAGPAGSTAALLLADAGLRVALLEKAARDAGKVCGEYLSPGCLPILDRVGVTASLRAAGGRAVRGIRLQAGGRHLQADYPRRPGSAAPLGLAVPRRILDPVLREAAGRRGAHVLREFQVSDLLREGPAVVGVRGRHQGREAGLRARLVLGADGRHSVVARRVGEVRRHPWLDKLALVGHFHGVRRAPDAAEIFVGAGCYAILNPVGEALTNVGAVADRADLRPAETAERQLARLLPAIPGLAERLDGAEPVAPMRRMGPLAHRAVRLSAPGAALLGDAAGFVDPFTGEGIYAALRSAELVAARALAALARERHPDLRAYTADWSREIRGKWPLCLLLQRAIRRPGLAALLVARLAARPAARARMMGLVGDLRPPGAAGLLALGLRLLLPARTCPSK